MERRLQLAEGSEWMCGKSAIQGSRSMGSSLCQSFVIWILEVVSFSEAPVSLPENLVSCSNDTRFSLVFSSNDDLCLLVSFCKDNIKSLPSLKRITIFPMLKITDDAYYGDNPDHLNSTFYKAPPFPK